MGTGRGLGCEPLRDNRNVAEPPVADSICTLGYSAIGGGQVSGLRSGEVFAGYQIERVLGHGGMGTVYLARHPRLPRLTALKLLNPEMFADTEIRSRFEREADLAAQLEHPNIVSVYDRGVEDTVPWIAMRYVAGTDAASLGIVDPERAMRIVTGIGAALDHAHRRGVLHRDIKPANILLDQPGSGEPERVLLTDFGIARSHDMRGLTRTGTFTATLAYASPEQLASLPLDHRCDQYSLACTLFTLLTGDPPFTASNPVALIDAQMRQPPPPLSSRRPDLPGHLDAVLARALAKRPEARFASCADFATAAAEALRTRGAPTVVAAPTPIMARPPVPVWPQHAPADQFMPPNQSRAAYHPSTPQRRPRRSWPVVLGVLLLGLVGIGATFAGLEIWDRLAYGPAAIEAALPAELRQASSCSVAKYGGLTCKITGGDAMLVSGTRTGELTFHGTIQRAPAQHVDNIRRGISVYVGELIDQGDTVARIPSNAANTGVYWSNADSGLAISADGFKDVEAARTFLALSGLIN
ncbi:serine/threonine-protein kinase [Nocardia halotolerans]|uniref:non-specific serine/threonine protein kinase n=1 Tax=Nocardia halotolerans TaxID=1755878 RepID=A0ABV8VQF8_9NOCA